jgi:hypothetical protein
VKVFEEKILKSVSEPQTSEATFSGVKLGLYNDEVNNLYPSPNIIRAMK